MLLRALFVLFLLRYCMWCFRCVIACVICAQGQFRDENFNTAMGMLKDAGDAAKGDQFGRKGGVKGTSRT